MEEGKRQIKHMEILNRISVLENAVQETWNLVYKINPGLASPKTDVEVAPDSQVSLSEFFALAPERISILTGRLREATETLDKEIY